MNADALFVALLNVARVKLELVVLGVGSKRADILSVVPRLDHIEAVKGSYESLRVDFKHTLELCVVEGGVDNEIEHTGLLSESVESRGHLGVSGLDLYVTNHIVLAAEVEEVFHKGKLGALEVGGELAAEVEVKKLLVGVLGNETLTVGGTVDLFIMEGYDLAVSGEVYVGFDTVSLHFSGELVSGHGVFGRISGSTAVRDNESAFSECLCHFSFFLSD
jgi:hypothetical protein